MSLTFGFSLLPDLNTGLHRELVSAADEFGLDYVGIQDHPYVPNYVDTFMLAATVLEQTQRLRVFPDVANLPLRPPAMLAKAAASLDLLSGGRFELALGAGGYWDAITTLGVERRTSPEANTALEEAVGLIRAIWAGGSERIVTDGAYYSAHGLKPGPRPAHPIEIWSGAQGPNAQRLTGRLFDGWAAPIPSYVPYEKLAGANARIDEAAEEAGRDPADIRRIAQIVGTITEAPGDASAREGDAPVRANADQWAGLVERLATEQPFTTFVFWPEDQNVDQVTRFATDVAARFD